MLKSGENDASIALRNCKRIEKLDDPVAPVKEILKLCPAERLISLYKLPSFSSVDDFLQKVATIRGKLKKGGIVDLEAAARIVLHDWNEGKIPYYTLPPTRDGVDLETTIVSEFGKEFDIDEVYKTESSFIGNLASVEDFRHVEVPPGAPLNFDEQMLEEDKVVQKETNQMDEPMITIDEKDPAEEKTNTSSRQNDKLYAAEGILDPRKRKAEKKRRKASKQNLLNQMDADYDFKVDFLVKDAPSDVDTAREEDDSDGNASEDMAGVEMDA